ncbi:unnamed protein product, partial [marine sediment metagenome]
RFILSVSFVFRKPQGIVGGASLLVESGRRAGGR